MRQTLSALNMQLIHPIYQIRQTLLALNQHLNLRVWQINPLKANQLNLLILKVLQMHRTSKMEDLIIIKVSNLMVFNKKIQIKVWNKMRP